MPMSPDSPTDRTDRLKIAAVAVVAALAAGLLFSAATVAGTASAQVHDFSVPDSSAETEAVDEIYVSFTGPTVSWSDTPEPVEEFDLRFLVEGPDGDMQEANRISCHHENAPADCGFDRSTDESVYLDAEAGPALISMTDWTGDHFSPGPGESVSHTIEIRAVLEIAWDGGSLTETASDTTTITVDHPEESGADSEASIEFGTAEATLVGAGG